MKTIVCWHIRPGERLFTYYFYPIYFAISLPAKLPAKASNFLVSLCNVRLTGLAVLHGIAEQSKYEVYQAVENSSPLKWSIFGSIVLAKLSTISIHTVQIWSFSFMPSLSQLNGIFYHNWKWICNFICQMEMNIMNRYFF